MEYGDNLALNYLLRKAYHPSHETYTSSHTSTVQSPSYLLLLSVINRDTHRKRQEAGLRVSAILCFLLEKDKITEIPKHDSRLKYSCLHAPWILTQLLLHYSPLDFHYVKKFTFSHGFKTVF